MPNVMENKCTFDGNGKSDGGDARLGQQRHPTIVNNNNNSEGDPLFAICTPDVIQSPFHAAAPFFVTSPCPPPALMSEMSVDLER